MNMKPAFFSRLKGILVLSFIFACVYSAHVYGRTKEITLHFDKDSFRLVESEGGFIVQSNNKKFCLGGLDGKLALPNSYVNILIALDEELESYDYITEKVFMRTGITLCQQEAPVPSCYLFQNCKKDVANQITSDYRTQIQFKGCHQLNGMYYLSFMVCPFEYDSTTQTLWFIPTIQLSIELKSVRKKLSNISNSQYTRCFQDVFVNDDELEILYHYNERERATSTVSDSIDYLLITSNALKPYFCPLLSWKKQKGIKSILLTTEEIYAQYSGISPQSKIKQAIKHYSNNHALQYVLLGGDIDIVPSQNCFIKYDRTDTTFIDSTPTDYYYANLQTMNWDANGNGIYGEVEDSLDLFPTVAVTRIPVSNAIAAMTIVNRIIQYEREPDIENWNDTILMSGYHTVEQNGQQVCRAQYKSNWLYQYYIAPYWDGGRFQFFITGDDFNDGLDHPLTSVSLQERFSKGYLLANILTHGTELCWALPNSDYDIVDASSLINSKPTIIVTSACKTNAFDYNYTCLSEAFLKNPNSNVLGYVGCSRYGWSNASDFYLGPSNQCSGYFYHRLFTMEEPCFGNVATWMKLDMLMHNMSYNYVYRWLLYGINPLGDPETPIFTSRPNVFSPPVVTVNNNRIVITCNVSGCRFSVMSLSDDGASYYNVTKNTSSTSFDIPSADCSVCVTKPGYVPYIINVVHRDYIQNEVITGNNIIISGNVIIGKDVTNEVSQGPVTIENGRTYIVPSNGVTIKNSFTINKGATFEIKQ